VAGGRPVEVKSGMAQGDIFRGLDPRPYTGGMTPVRRIAATLVLSLTSLAAGSVAGQTRGPVQRIVHGKVEDKNGAGIKGAVVYLKDDHSSAVKSAIAADDGSYRFVQLSPNTDYELWAQSDSRRSATKSISSFDSKSDITITLKIDM
jgi:Carboxypeptidase regulatory-like domain